MSAKKRRAVFLDRDGVLIRDVHYLRRPDQIRIYRGAPPALRALREAGFKLVVVTNQSGVARGYLTLKTLAEVHATLRRMLRAQGAVLDALYFCPHSPGPQERAVCRCRKPETGMLEDAARDLSLDLEGSVMVGDTTADMEAARRAGCLPLLVRTGKGGRDGKHPLGKPRTFKNLAAAARWIVRHRDLPR